MEWSDGDMWSGERVISEPSTEFKFVMAKSSSIESALPNFEWSGPHGSNIMIDLPSEGLVEIKATWEGETLSMDVKESPLEAEAPTPITKAVEAPVVKREEAAAAEVPQVDRKSQEVLTKEIPQEAPMAAVNIVEAPKIKKGGRKANGKAAAV